MSKTGPKPKRTLPEIAAAINRDWLLARCNVVESGCWVFKNCPDDQGTATFRVTVDGWLYSVRGSRLMLTVEGVDVPEGVPVKHLCFNPLCLNPAHLRVVHPREIAKAAFESGRRTTKLTQEQMAELRACKARGESCVSLARRFGVSQGTVKRIIRG